jgi:TnpA family transposase
LAFRELGKVVRTGFLLRYIASAELRSTIQVAMNKSEQFNAFVKWVSFGGDRLETNDRDLQSKIVQYQHLVANCLIYFTVSELTGIVKELKEEGFEVSQEALAHINPYLTEHINRFGDYRINLDRTPLRPDYDFKV